MAVWVSREPEDAGQQLQVGYHHTIRAALSNDAGAIWTTDLLRIADAGLEDADRQTGSPNEVGQPLVACSRTAEGGRRWLITWVAEMSGPAGQNGGRGQGWYNFGRASTDDGAGWSAPLGIGGVDLYWENPALAAGADGVFVFAGTREDTFFRSQILTVDGAGLITASAQNILGHQAPGRIKLSSNRNIEFVSSVLVGNNLEFLSDSVANHALDWSPGGVAFWNFEPRALDCAPAPSETCLSVSPGGYNPTSLWIDRSIDGGETWSTQLLDTPPIQPSNLAVAAGGSSGSWLVFWRHGPAGIS